MQRTRLQCHRYGLHDWVLITSMWNWCSSLCGKACCDSVRRTEGENTWLCKLNDANSSGTVNKDCWEVSAVILEQFAQALCLQLWTSVSKLEFTCMCHLGMPRYTSYDVISWNIFYCNNVCPPLQYTIYILIILHQQLMLCSESHGYTLRLSPVMYSCKCEQIVDSWCVTPHLSLLVSAGVGVPNSLIGLLCVVK